MTLSMTLPPSTINSRHDLINDTPTIDHKPLSTSSMTKSHNQQQILVSKFPWKVILGKHRHSTPFFGDAIGEKKALGLPDKLKGRRVSLFKKKEEKEEKK